ncbi:hypothetical protein [Croceivirga sp. JEA036]|uniref:hypothetical protein n=1 Tax=Croceivirga sp. JEA036 TaxID=2721162 RepID=UPI00143C6334|nr:hypothetical protein [Croceivirga sp. JEA036]NJB36221.1 hypothetical protein [Croceivirga sp. JEA036]
MKKTFVLIVLFVLPLVAYLFFASGVNNFGRLPVLQENVEDVAVIADSIQFKSKITILGFLGVDVASKSANAFNLNQKIYKRFSEFKDFQFVMLVPKGQEAAVNSLKEELGKLSEIDKWNFVFADAKEVIAIFNSLNSNLKLDEDLGSNYVFIVDKDANLRGRKDDEDEGTKYGYNATSVAELNNKMEDDVKIILAEYRLALKKNNATRSK